MRITKLTLLIIITSSLGCTSIHSIFKSDGYYHKDFPYKINNTENGRLLSSKWKIDNYRLNSNGEPTKIKKGRNYEINLNLENNRTWKIERTRYPAYDLNFINRLDDGGIWLRTIPLSNDLSQTKLRVMLKRVVEAIAGEGLVAQKINSKTTRGRSIRYATKIISSEPAVVHGHEAYAAVIEIANIDQLKLSPDSRWSRAEIILIRTSYLWKPKGFNTGYYPVLMMAGYSNLPEDFESGRPEFHDFIKRLQISTYPSLPDKENDIVLTCAPNLDNVRLIAKSNPQKRDSHLKQSKNKIDDIYDVQYVSQINIASSIYLSPDLTSDQLDCVNKHQFSMESGKTYLVSKNQLKSSYETKLPKLTLKPGDIAKSSD